VNIVKKTMKKIKKVLKTKKLQEAEKVFKESHVMVILEDMRDSIKLVAEGQIGLQRQLDGLTDEVHSFRDETDIRFAQVNARFAQVDARFDQMDARFDQMDARFDQMDIEFAQVKADQKVTLEHLFNVDERFEALEKELQEVKLELVRLSKKILSPEETKSFSKRIVIIERDMEKFRVFMRSNAGLKSA